MTGTSDAKGWANLAGTDLVRDAPAEIKALADSIAAYYEPSAVTNQAFAAGLANWDTTTTMTRVRAGQLVTFYASIKRITTNMAANSGFDTIATLPAGWRPSMTVQGECESPANGSDLGFKISTDGTIQVRNNAGSTFPTGQFCNFSVTFICDRA